MKILIILLSLAFVNTGVRNNDPDRPEEKEMISVEKTDIFEYLNKTKNELESSVEDLSEEQMAYEPEDGGWSIAEIVEHIIIVEGALKGMLEAKIKAGEDLDQVSEVKMTDEQVMGMITDRSSSIQTQDQFQPTGKFSEADEALEAFNDQRENIVTWLKDSDANMRNYVNEFPFGKLDAYQTVIFMAGHTARHTDQIEEVKSSPDFPE